MININFQIALPRAANDFYTLFDYAWQLTANKFLEIECVRDNTLIEVSLSITTSQDHAGTRLTFALFGYTITTSVYDHRHWNYETNEWNS